MPPLPKPQLRELTRRFQQQLLLLGDRASPALAAEWLRLEHYNEEQIADFVAAVTPVTRATKHAAVRGAVGYYALAAGVRPPAIRPDTIPIEPQFREPFISVWQALGNGAPFEDAVLAGQHRTDAIVRNLISSSSRATGDLVVSRARLKVEGFERVTNVGACAWCLDVAGSVYSSADAADFGHDRCGCTAQPIYA